jgi:hypothetical protein
MLQFGPTQPDPRKTLGWFFFVPNLARLHPESLENVPFLGKSQVFDFLSSDVSWCCEVQRE